VGSQQANPCPSGENPTDVYEYTAKYTGQVARISDGPGGPPMTVQQECTPCSPGTVEVIDNSDPQPYFAPLCVSPPPTCASGTYPEWIPASPQIYDLPPSVARWECRGPCDVLLPWGNMFGNRLVCAQKPMSTGCSGFPAQFDLLEYVWVCNPTPSCNPYGMSDYDDDSYEGVPVCVPC
jgi:hypothetical protein